MDENGHGAVTHSQKIRDSLSITGSDLILLGVIWTDDQSSNRFGMFPEAIACDLTEKMNSEERSCMVIAGKDSNNQVFSHTLGFLPSAANWALDWALRRGFCILHPKQHLSRVQVILTDQDGQLCNAVYNVVGPGKPMEVAAHRLCAWHKLNRNFVKHADFQSLISDLEGTNRVEFEVICAWLWDCVRNTETKEELSLMLGLLAGYLQEEEDDECSHRGKLCNTPFSAFGFADVT